MPDGGANEGAVVLTLDLRAFMSGELDDVVLGPRDVIFVDTGHPRGVVYIDGKIARPGVYQLPEGGRLTAGRLMTAAGGAAAGDHERDAINVRVIRAETINALEGQREFLLSRRESESFALLPDDHVIVETRKTAAPE